MGLIFTRSNTVTSRFIEAYNHLRKAGQFDGAGDFSKRTGITIGKIKKVMDGEWEVGDMEASAVGEAFPQLRMDWILDGEGQMLHPGQEPKTEVKTKAKPGPKPKAAGEKGVSIIKESKTSRPEAFRDPVSGRFYRFIEYLVEKGKVKNVTQFGKRIDTSGAVFTAMKAGMMSITTERTERTAREFPELNMNWLFTGTGNMINGADVKTPEASPTGTPDQTNLPESIIGKLKECRILLYGSWAAVAEGTGLQQEDLDLLEAGQKQFIPHELLQYLHQGGVDINSIFDSNAQSASFRQQGEVNYEEILKRLNLAEMNVLEMQKSNRENLAELQQLRKILNEKATAHN